MRNCLPRSRKKTMKKRSLNDHTGLTACGSFFIGRSAFAHLCEQGKQKKQGAPLAFMIDQADAHMSARSLCAEIIVLFPFSDRKNQVKRT